jgi:hypothetical protein
MEANRKMMRKMSSFCTFIISHGRPDKVVTLKTLKRCGYTGPLFIVCDNEDKTLDQYRRNFGVEMVLVFDKIHYASLVDNCDNFQNRRTTTHARNACFDFAEQLGFEYFLVLDDDYTSFSLIKETQKNTTDIRVKKFSLIAESVIKFLDSDNRISSICFLQSGDTIGGMANFKKWDLIFPFSKRKAMNSFFCKTARRFWFFSRLNEDVNTYLALGNVGHLFMTIPQVLLQQVQTQATAGGMSEAYLASGTYVKSFYTVMIGPSYAVATVTPSMKRLHHKISWNNAVPKILDEAYRKQ